MPFETPSYVKAMLLPTAKSASRKVWSIDLEAVWLPFFTATNVQGDTSIPKDVLGAPIRLSKTKDGEVKFSQNGKPVFRVVKDLADQIRMAREAYTASLVDFAKNVQHDKPDAYKAEIQSCYKAGQPIAAAMVRDVEEAIFKAALAEEAEREAVPA